MLHGARLTLIVAVAAHWVLQLAGWRPGVFWSGAAVHLGATAAWVWLVRALVLERWRPGFFEVGALAVLLRLLVLPLDPGLSDDVFRYLHEGHLMLRGENPYLVPPALVPEELRLDTWSRINHGDVPAAYPPAMQFAMALGFLVHPSPLGMKLVFGLCDLLAFAALWRLLPWIGVPGKRAAVYGLCPLVVLEFAGEGHGDSLAVLGLVLCLWAAAVGRGWLAGLALGLATAGKLLPIAFLPHVAARAGRFAIVPLAVLLAALYAPFVLDARILDGSQPLHALFAGSLRYGDAWRHNDSVFHLLHLASEATLQWLNGVVGATTWISYFPHRVAKVPILLAGLALLAVAFVRRWPLPRAMAAFFVFFVACTPTLHPWYVAFLVPFLCIYPAGGWLWFCGTVYLAHFAADWQLTTGWKVLEYAPFYAGFCSAPARALLRPDPAVPPVAAARG